MSVRAIFKSAHRAARIDFYAVADFPGMAASAQLAVSASRDPFVMRARGEKATLAQEAAQRSALRQSEFGRLLLELS